MGDSMFDYCERTGKIVYRTRADAMDVTRRRKRLKALNVFRCAFCRGWHLGKGRDVCVNGKHYRRAAA